MKRLGLIGGIGPESTIEYYRMILKSYQEKNDNGSNPHLIINSIDMKKMLGLIDSKEFGKTVDYIVEELKKLADAGAEFGIITSNTPHIVFDEINEKSPLPLISIVEATCEEAKSHNFKKAGLFGTKFTMRGGFYNKVFEKDCIEVITPDIKEHEYIHYKYMNELVNGIFSEETKKKFLVIVDNMINEHNIDCLVLGGTEIPLLIKDKYYRGIELLNTTKIHVEAAVAQMLI